MLQIALPILSQLERNKLNHGQALSLVISTSSLMVLYVLHKLVYDFSQTTRHIWLVNIDTLRCFLLCCSTILLMGWHWEVHSSFMDQLVGGQELCFFSLMSSLKRSFIFLSSISTLPCQYCCMFLIDCPYKQLHFSGLKLLSFPELRKALSIITSSLHKLDSR